MEFPQRIFPRHLRVWLHVSATLLTTLTLLSGSGQGQTYSKNLTLGVILPLNNTYFWSLPKTRFAVEFALDTMRARQLLPGWEVKADYRDSKCSETDGPLEAINMHYDNLQRNPRSALVFLGPACDFAVAPIARFSKHWGIPVITAGGFVKAFEDKKEYPLLTRLMGTYAKAAEFVIEIFRHFRWSTVGLMYHDFDREGGFRSDCYFVTEALFFALTTYTKPDPWYAAFDENLVGGTNKYEQLLREAHLKTRIYCGRENKMAETGFSMLHVPATVFKTTTFVVNVRTMSLLQRSTFVDNRVDQ